MANPSSPFTALFFVKEGYNVTRSPLGLIACYDRYYTREANNAFEVVGDTMDGWRNGTALTTSFPYFVTQLFVSNLTYRVLFYLCRPLFIPRFIAQILTGIILGPSGFGYSDFFEKWVFPYRFIMVMETFANLTLVYHMFLVGLEMDLGLIKRSGSKAISIAAAGMALPMALGTALYYKMPTTGLNKRATASGYVYWAIALATTNFPDLAKILTDLKLLRSEAGKTAMSAAVLTDLGTWILFIGALSAFNKDGTANSLTAYTLVSTLVFILFCIFVLRPALAWIIERTTKEGHVVSENHIWFILAGVMLCGLITDACGSHAIIGAFMLGVIMPRNHIIGQLLIEKLEDFMNGILMPLFFVVTGLRVNLGFLFQITKGYMVVIIIATFFVKIISTYIVSYIHGLPTRDGLAIGLLMNTKGILSLIILNAGRDVRALDSQTFPAMIVALFVMSLLVQPIIAFGYKPKKVAVNYKNRTIQRINKNTELRVLACMHDIVTASGIIKLLELSNATNMSPLSIFAIHLMELTGRTTASMLILNDDEKPRGNIHDSTKAESNQIVEALGYLEELNTAVTTQTVTGVSPYATMHEDICTMAEDKCVSFIILPYHKRLTTDGRLDEGNPSHALVNQNVLEEAPCSVGILVDRGINAVVADDDEEVNTTKLVAMLFFGGPDDREALTYAWRMAGESNVNLIVIKFVPGRQAIESLNRESNSEDDMLESSLYEREKQIDDECVYEFTFKTMNDPSITYMEKVVNSGQETIAAIRDMEEYNYNLYIVGRGKGVKSPLTEGLSDWDSCPELGTIGDTLTTANFSLHASVLVIQQYSVISRQEAKTTHKLSILGHSRRKSAASVEHASRSSHMTYSPPSSDDDSDSDTDILNNNDADRH